ncbi:MAG TPA: DNA repair protein RecN [Kofleriaceae bacterium]|nr:DNA repair protein RecN [Kofleriaceae bacterium]
MLRHLRVTNFAILSDVELELGSGMIVLTGETGAGKSLIVEAVNLLRGGRASADIPRAGADEAVVEAIVEVPEDLRARVAGILEAAGLPKAEGGGDEIFIRRVILRATDRAAEAARGGRSRTYINGALTTAARLAELGALLIDLSGQHQHQGLVDPGRHLELLDAFADNGPLGAAMGAAWAELRRTEQELAALGGDEREREARLDFLRYQLEELDAAALTPGEDARIELERARLASVDQLQGAARAAEEHLYGGDGSARDRVAAAARELERAARTDPGLEPVHRQLGEIETLLDDAADQLRGYADRLEGDPERLAYLDDRLALIRRLTRKHGAGLDEVIGKAGALRAELDALAGRDTRLAELTDARARAMATATGAAAQLTQSRRKAARRLEKEVGAALAELGMAAARLTVVIEPRVPGLGPTGADRIELMLASNKGEDTRPLTKVASGGELSRIMLALKLGLLTSGRIDDVATYVFDEVDAGIGGATAQVVGSQIRALADHRQVLCVTHLPQIAAYADHHFHVEKAEQGGRTETHVRKLGAAARKDELARMLGGHATSKARAHAAELLAEAARPRKPASASARASASSPRA